MDNLIKSALPGVDDEAIKKLIHKLDEIGVLSIEDFQFIDEEDIREILKPIQIKKFIKFCKETLPSSSVVTFDPIPQGNESFVSLDGHIEVSKNSNILSTPKSILMNPSPQFISSWAERLSIDWNLFPKEIEEAHINNYIPLKKHVNEMVRMLTVQILNVEKNPGRKYLRIITYKVIEKYPNLFHDRCREDVIGNGCITLLKKLENCIENKKRQNVLIEENFEGIKKRKTIRDSYGCINWQPAELPVNETKEILKEHKMWLINEFKKQDKDENEVEILMRKTYASQRYYINNIKKSILSIKENWPFLTEEKFLIEHSETLLGVNLKNTFNFAVPTKGKKIYDFMTLNASKHVKLCMNSILQAKSKLNNLMPEIIGAIPLLLAYFKEDQTLLFKERMHLSTNSDACNAVLTPYITTFGFSIYEAEEFAIVIDGYPVVYINSFTSALACLFASYYVFNIEYNKGTAHTMEFIQRCYANISPSKGAKVAKKKNSKQYSVSPKVLKLANKLKSFESDFNI